MSLDALKAEVCAAIDAQADRIMGISDAVMRAPETGFREEATARLVRAEFDRLGIAYRHGLARTGVKGRLRGRSSRRTVAVMGEMDSLISTDHPFADPVTGAAHSCGHNAEIASMIGAGIGLRAVMDALDGDVVLFAVPAEECVELDWRLGLRAAGEIEFVVGKAELIRLGEFDDVDMAMLTHTFGPADGPLAWIGGTTNGSVVKRASFGGRRAHAGAAPWDGINAVKALTLALAAIDAQRDTYRDEDQVRIHYLVTETGDALTAVPARASVELMVRAASAEALADAAGKVDRALRAGALALGASVHITSASGYLPLACDENLVELTQANAAALLGPDRVARSWGAMSGSTDTGDLGMLMPVVHPMAPSGGADLPHSDRYHVHDHALAAVNPAKFMAMTVVDLLHEGARRADEVLAQAGPKLTREAYLALRRSLDGDIEVPRPT
jgi:amidohydrolase